LTLLPEGILFSLSVRENEERIVTMKCFSNSTVSGSFVAIIVGAAAFGFAQTSGHERPTTRTASGITRTELERHPLAGTDQEMRLYLIVYPPGVASPVHHHAAVGMGYVLSGTVESAFGNEKPRTYHTGESFVDEAVTPHTISRNVDRRKPLKLLLYYVLKPGQPAVETP